MVRKLLSQVIAAGLGLWLATQVVPRVTARLFPDSSFFGVPITNLWQLFILLGIILGLLNFFAKPILNVITLPLRIITLGLFGFLVNMALVWAIDMMFAEFSAPWFWPLFWATLCIWASNLIISSIVVPKEHTP